MSVEEWTKEDVEIKHEDGTTTRFTIIHDMNLHGAVGSFDAAMQNWLARTTEFTAESFCNYVSEKREKGFCNDYACTEEQFKNILGFEA